MLSKEEIQRIQSKLLWHGNNSSRSIHWVSWKVVCKSKEEGGLGIKDLEVFNRALLSKWRWRIIKEKEVIWSGIVRHRYISLVLKLLSSNCRDIKRGDYIWWRDLVLLDSKIEDPVFSFLTIFLVG